MASARWSNLTLFWELTSLRIGSVESSVVHITSICPFPGRSLDHALGRVWLLFGAGRALEDLDDHPEVVVGGEVGELDAAEGAAEHQVVSPLGLLRHRVVEVRRGDGDVVDAFALLGEEARPDALLVERLDQLPHYPADHGGGEAGDGAAPRASDRLAVLVQVFRILGVELVDLPRADPVVVDVPAQRGVEVAHDDPDLHRLGEDGPARRAVPGLVHAHLPPISFYNWLQNSSSDAILQPPIFGGQKDEKRTPLALPDQP